LQSMDVQFTQFSVNVNKIKERAVQEPLFFASWVAMIGTTL